MLLVAACTARVSSDGPPSRWPVEFEARAAVDRRRYLDFFALLTGVLLRRAGFSADFLGAGLFEAFALAGVDLVALAGVGVALLPLGFTAAARVVGEALSK